MFVWSDESEVSCYRTTVGTRQAHSSALGFHLDVPPTCTSVRQKGPLTAFKRLTLDATLHRNVLKNTMQRLEFCLSLSIASDLVLIKRLWDAPEKPSPIRGSSTSLLKEFKGSTADDSEPESTEKLQRSCRVHVSAVLIERVLKGQQYIRQLIEMF